MRARLLPLLLCLPLLGCFDLLPDPAEPPAPKPPKPGNDGTPNTPPAEAFVPPLPKADVEAGWIALFNGESLFGWRPHDEAAWTVEDGAIVSEQGEKGLLVTSVPFADFWFRCKFRLEPGGNSGVFLRTAADPTDPAVDCYEFNLCDTHEAFRTGGLVGRKATKFELDTEDGEWHDIEVHCEGPHVFGYVDGNLVLEYFDKETPDLRSGLIGLQRNDGDVAFRDVHVLPLGAQPLLDGDSLDGWREVPGNEASFEVVTPSGESQPVLRVQGGPGFLETTETYGDFVLQFDARTNAPRVNSGVFFRAEEGTEDAPSNGYELQIHHGVADGDRTKPNDYGDGWGTGAIFRRRAARLVAGDDEQWATITLVAHGNRFATWVNGYPVTVFEDDREPNDNPREGRRDEAGHVSLQAHDAETAIDFRNLDLSRYPE